jgi:hypothetical protein
MSAFLYASDGASTSLASSSTLVLNRKSINTYHIPWNHTEPYKYVDVSRLARKGCQHSASTQYTLSIQPEWPTDLSRPDENYIIAQGLMDSWNPLASWNEWDSFGKVASVVVDIRYLPIDEQSIQILRDNPPSLHTRVIVNTQEVKYFGSTLPAQISEQDAESITNAWWEKIAQEHPRSRMQVVVDAAYKLRYYLATAAVAYAGYRYMQNNHATWTSQQFVERTKIVDTITTLENQIDTLQTIIAQVRNGATEYSGTQIVHAFDTILAQANKLFDAKLALLVTPEWNRWLSLLKAVKDKWFLLVKSLGAIWLVDNYIVRKLLAYAPFEYPSIEIRNDLRAYNCGWLHHMANGTVNSAGFTCCNSRLDLDYAPATLTERQKVAFNRNRTIAAALAAGAFWASSFQAGRMLYRNADKLMAMLSK